MANPDGRQDTYEYALGCFTRASPPEASEFQAWTAPSNAICTTVYHGTTNSPYGLAYRTTKEGHRRGHRGQVLTLHILIDAAEEGIRVGP